MATVPGTPRPADASRTGSVKVPAFAGRESKSGALILSEIFLNKQYYFHHKQKQNKHLLEIDLPE